MGPIIVGTHSAQRTLLSLYGSKQTAAMLRRAPVWRRGKPVDVARGRRADRRRRSSTASTSELWKVSAPAATWRTRSRRSSCSGAGRATETDPWPRCQSDRTRPLCAPHHITSPHSPARMQLDTLISSAFKQWFSFTFITNFIPILDEFIAGDETSETTYIALCSHFQLPFMSP